MQVQVLETKSTVFRAPDLSSRTVATTGYGQILEMLTSGEDEYGIDWCQVELPDRTVGWITSSSLHRCINWTKRVAQTTTIYASMDEGSAMAELPPDSEVVVGLFMRQGDAEWLGVSLPDGRAGFVSGDTKWRQREAAAHPDLQSPNVPEDHAIFDPSRFIVTGISGLLFGAAGGCLILVPGMFSGGLWLPPDFMIIPGAVLWYGPLWSWGRMAAALGSWRSAGGLKTIAAGAVLGGLFFSLGSGIGLPYLRIALGSPEVLRLGAFWLSGGFWSMTALGVVLSAVLILNVPDFCDGW